MAENELFSSTRNGKLHFSVALDPDLLRPRSIHLVMKHQSFPQWRCSLEIKTGEHSWFMPSQQHTDRPGPRKQRGKPDEDGQRVLGEMLTSRDPGSHLKTSRTQPCCSTSCPWETWTLLLAEAGLWATGLSWSSWGPVPEVGSWGTHQRGAATAPLCSLLTACFDQPLGLKHHCSYSPQGVGAQPKTPRRSNTSQHKW